MEIKITNEGMLPVEEEIKDGELTEHEKKLAEIYAQIEMDFEEAVSIAKSKEEI